MTEKARLIFNHVSRGPAGKVPLEKTNTFAIIDAETELLNSYEQTKIGDSQVDQVKNQDIGVLL